MTREEILKAVSELDEGEAESFGVVSATNMIVEPVTPRSPSDSIRRVQPDGTSLDVSAFQTTSESDAASFGLESALPEKPEDVIAVRVGTPSASDPSRPPETKINVIDPKTKRVKLMQG